MLAFITRPRASQAWFPAGLASSYPDIDPSTDPDNLTAISDARPCGADKNTSVPGCKVFSVPNGDVTSASEVPISEGGDGDGRPGLKDQVMVFRYRGRFHAVDHVSSTLLRLY